MTDNMSGEDERSDEKTDPGSIRHGNFINYYQFHPAEERVRQLPRGVWQRLAYPARKYAGLDVGCNIGVRAAAGRSCLSVCVELSQPKLSLRDLKLQTDLTYVLRDFLEEAMSRDQSEISLIGVDLDPILIERARERNPRPDRLTFECLDFLSEDCDKTLKTYLARLYKTRFDVVFCFSITMWIHLNHGDDGLEKFLQRACDLAEMIVIEPQLWKCYRAASRRLRRTKSEDFPLRKKLKYNGNMTGHIENILTRMCDFKKVAVTAANNWGRTLLIYERKTI